MANSELYDNTYVIPSEILKSINSVLISNPNGEGVKRAKALLKNGRITYQSLKRLKNFFDYFNPQSGDKLQYMLAGGDLMRSFVERTLNANRDAVKRSKVIKSDIHANPNSELKAGSIPRLSNMNESDNKKSKITKNACAIIVDKDNKILLLKRADNKDVWMPNKWSLVGGGVDKGESPEQACKREIKEETTLEINDFINSFSIQRNSLESIEHMFVCRYDGEPTDVNLNQENVKYGWFTVSEIDYLDTVPHLMEYLVIAFKKYE